MTDSSPETYDVTSGVEFIVKAYAAGQPLFPRSLLEKLDRQLSEGQETVYIEDLEGKSQGYPIKVPNERSRSM
jgi:hypothetical protein